VSGHAQKPAHFPWLAPSLLGWGAAVQGAASAEDLDSLALRAALNYRRGGDKRIVLALRFGMNEADVGKALNGHDRTPRRILERLTVLERATFDRVRAEAEQAARRAA